MRSNRRKNWFVRRIALGFAVAAIAAPAAQAQLDQGGAPQTSSKAIAQRTFWEGSQNVNAADQIEAVRLQPRSTGASVVAADYGMPRAMPNDYALSSGDQIEVVRAQPRGNASDKIEFVRSKPRSIGEPQVVAAGFNWKDAGIGAGFALALILLGGGAALATRHTGREQTA